jgi:DNA-binding transcriptional regulator GbsR (MarR family)
MAEPQSIPGAETVPTELCELASEVGNFIRYWGFKKIHGKIWTHLYLSKVPLDAGTLMRRLNVSKALMSLSLHDLMDYEVILEAGKSDKGTQLFTANQDVVTVIVNVLKRRERKMLELIQATHKTLKDRLASPAGLDPVCAQKLKNLEAMIQEAKVNLDSILELATLDLNSWQDIAQIKN